MKHRGWIAFSGFMWLVIGSFLLYKGLHLISEATLRPDSLSSRWGSVWGTAHQTATLLMVLGLFVGFLKGRFVLSKTVHRVAMRINSLPLPIRLVDVYRPSYWILIGSMVVLGISLRFLPIPIDVRGLIDVAVGSALIHGAMLYFRFARSLAAVG
jgi:hypothetical protein